MRFHVLGIANRAPPARIWILFPHTHDESGDIIGFEQSADLGKSKHPSIRNGYRIRAIDDRRLDLHQRIRTR